MIAIILIGEIFKKGMNLRVDFEIPGAVMDIQLGNLFFSGEIHPLVIIIAVSSSNHPLATQRVNLATIIGIITSLNPQGLGI